jgi:hypothetical protein
MLMAYHTATFRLLGFEPQHSNEEDASVREVEDRLGISLPKSVREWYAHHNAIQVLAEHSNGDPPIPLKKFALIDWRSLRLLPFRNENQGVCTWAVALDGSEDPPVYVDVDSSGREWRVLAPSFSAYVYSCVWDYRMIFGRPAMVQAQNGPLSRSALAVLAAAFAKEIQTHGWPGNTQYRFAKDGQAILIWSSEKQADWFVAAGDAATLERALGAVWDLDDLGKSLYDCSEIGKDVL